MKNQFRYDYANMGNTLACLGDLEWDKEKKQWKATMIVQRDPEIRFEAWDDDGAIAGLLCVAKWCGRDLQNVKEHATLSAGASVDHGVEVGITENHVYRAADRGCCVSTCCALGFIGLARQG